MKPLPPMRATVLALLLPVALLARNRSPEGEDKSAPPLHPNLPSLFIVGDSSVGREGALRTPQVYPQTSAPANHMLGWGFALPPYFDLNKINVLIRAEGVSTRTYLERGYWERLLPQLKAGDLVLLQFGEFEVSPVDDPHHGAGPLPGLGEESRSMNGLTHQETVHTYGWYMRKFIADVRARGAIPIVLSPDVRNLWTGGKADRGPDGVRDWAAAVARSERAPFVDATSLLAGQFDQLGEAKTRSFFYNDAVHPSVEGARFYAAVIVSGLKALSNPSLARYFSPRADKIPTAAPAFVTADR